MKKKVEKLEDLYEDEESQKMLEIIRQNAKTAIKQKGKKKKSNGFNKLEIAFIILSTMFIAFSIWFVYIYKPKEKNKMDECISITNDKGYCEQLFEGGN